MKALSMVALIVFFGATAPVVGESPSYKAKAKRYETLQFLLFMQAPVANFGDKAQQKEYEDFKKLYTAGLAYFFEDNYVEAYYSFVDTQMKIEKFYENFSQAYIDRTSEMLRFSAKDVVELEIDYNRDSQILKTFLKNRKPEAKLEYDPKDFHFAYDKKPIVKNLEIGFGILGQAKEIRQTAINFDKYAEEGKKIDPKMRVKRIRYYKSVIDLCRQAKTNAIRVFQMYNRNDIVSAQTQFRENEYYVEKKLDPIFDPRIPKEYVVDANDNLGRIYANEIRIKLGEKPKEELEDTTIQKP